MEKALIEDNMEIFDISPIISSETAVFPGDAPFREEFSMQMSRGHHLTLSKIETSVHIGAHVDAPNHYSLNGVSIGERSLHFYMGPVQVVDMSRIREPRIVVEHLRNHQILAPRLIFKTGSFPNPNEWNGDFTALSSELIRFLAGEGVILVGIDTPSIDPANDEKLESHNEVSRHDMAILEGVVLDEVTDGLYNLIALPLRMQGADASPVRAILMRGKEK